MDVSARMLDKLKCTQKRNVLNFFIFFTPQGTKFPQGNSVSRQLIHNKEYIHREKDTNPRTLKELKFCIYVGKLIYFLQF